MKPLKEIYIKNKLNLILLVITAIIYLAVFLIWHYSLRYQDIYIFSLSGVYPIRLLTIVVILNLILSYASYEKEKEITPLLLGANVFLSTLILVLEIFYLVNSTYV